MAIFSYKPSMSGDHVTKCPLYIFMGNDLLLPRKMVAVLVFFFFFAGDQAAANL